MRIGIIGAGNVGSTLGKLLVRAGHEVTLSHRGAPDELAELVAQLGGRARAATVDEAARDAEVTLLAIPFGRFQELSPAAFARNVVVDATNYYPDRDGDFPEIDDGGVTSSELIARYLVEARLVKAFNNLPMSVLEERARPPGAPDRLALPVSSDFPEARRMAMRLVDEVGYDPIDLGGLVDGGRLQQQGGPLFLRALDSEALLAAIDSARAQPLPPVP